MASYVVMEPPAATDEEAVDELIRDGFSFPAFVISPLWLLWHRLWIEAALFFAGSLAIVTAAEQAGSAPPARRCHSCCRSMSAGGPASEDGGAAPARLGRVGRGRCGFTG